MLLIDVSGSMQVSVDPEGTKEPSGFSRLDLVRQAARAVLASARPQDRVGIISYSTTAQVALPLARVPSSAVYGAVLDGLRPDGRTNIFGALSLASSQLERVPGEGRARSILLFTDGKENVTPPRGTAETFERVARRTPLLRGVVLDTFGFGCDLDLFLLRRLAAGQQGAFHFISDASMMLTCLLHSVANQRATVATLPCLPGRLIRGQPTILPAGAPVVLSAPQYNVPLRLRPEPEGKDALVEVANDALNFAGALGKVLQLEDAKARQATLAAAAALAVGEAFREDLLGEATKACSAEYWGTWGEPYIVSLHEAHLRMRPINFKDASLQVYARDEEFAASLESLEDLLAKLPEPKRSCVPSRSRFGGAAAAPAPTVSMYSRFYNRDGGCFTPTSRLLIDDGKTWVPFHAVRPGAQVTVVDVRGAFSTATVHLVVRTPCPAALAYHVAPGTSLALSRWHPVANLYPGGSLLDFYFPAESQENFANGRGGGYELWNVVLSEPGVSLVVGNNMDQAFAALPLGHGIKYHPTAAHAYFGDRERVVADLVRIGFSPDGVVDVSQFARDDAEGEVVGMV